MNYDNILEEIESPLPLLADYPEYVEPLKYEHRYLAPPVVYESDGRLLVRSWRYWYNARGIVEMENRLEEKATAIVNVHPWGVDDGHGLKTPEPAGCALFCTPEKNAFGLKHVQDVINPFFQRLRSHVALIAHSMPGVEDEIRKLLYPSISTKPEELDIEKGEKLLAELFSKHEFQGSPLVEKLTLDAGAPVKSYFQQTPSTDAGDRYNGAGQEGKRRRQSGEARFKVGRHGASGGLRSSQALALSAPQRQKAAREILVAADAADDGIKRHVL